MNQFYIYAKLSCFKKNMQENKGISKINSAVFNNSISNLFNN